MRRIGLAVSLTVSLALAPLVAEAQTAGKVYRIGYLSGASLAASKPFLEQFQQELRKLGYAEGQNVVIEYRWAEGKQERLPELAADLVRLKVDLIVAQASTAAQATYQATRTIPIVMVAVGDPMRLGLIASLGRPGGNVTGTASYLPELSGKPLEILTEIVPSIKRVALLWNPANPLHAGVLGADRRAGAQGAVAIAVPFPPRCGRWWAGQLQSRFPCHVPARSAPSGPDSQRCQARRPPRRTAHEV